MVFTLNPYDATLDLSDKDDRKLFEVGTRGLQGESRFGGDVIKFPKFRKLIRRLLEKIRSIESFRVGKDWNNAAAAPRAPSKFHDIFLEKGIDSKSLKEHVDLVWADTEFGPNDNQTPNYFFDHGNKAPGNQAELDAVRNARKMKHVMIGQVIWNSLDPDFQIEMMNDKEKYMVNENMDGVLLWDHMVTHVNPSTKVSVANLKDEIESGTLNDHGQDVKMYNQ